MKLSKSEQAIIKTLVYFDLISRPLNENELYSYLYTKKCDRRKMYINLENLLRKKVVVEKDGYYGLKNQKIISQKQREKILEQKWQIAQKVASKMLWIPYLRGVLVIHSLANGTAKESSDIDFLIITAKGRLFLCRFFCVLYNILSSHKKTRFNQKDKIDLGFYLTKDGLNIEKTKLDSEDILTTYFLVTAKPLYNLPLYQKLIDQNKWLKEKLPNFKAQNFNYQLIQKRPSKIKDNLEKLLAGKLGNFLNLILKKIQIWKIYLDPKSKSAQANVRVSDQIIELHHRGLRKEMYQMWQEKNKSGT